MTGWELPLETVIGGSAYAIHADYRDVLEIIARLDDPDEAEYTRVVVSLALFYDGFEKMPESDYEEAARYLMRFINCGEEVSGGVRAKTIDWEQDRQMIIADVNKAAHTEVRALPFLHWWTFMAYFGAIGEGQLSTVVAIREKRRKGQKLEKWEREFYQENRERVDFRKRYTKEEAEEKARLEKLLSQGGYALGV